MNVAESDSWREVNMRATMTITSFLLLGWTALPAQPGPLDCDRTSAGAIVDADQQDRWTFVGAAGDVVTVSLSQTFATDEGFSVRADVLLPDGSALRRFLLPSSHSVLVLPESGVHEVVAYDLVQRNRGGYALQVRLLGGNPRCTEASTTCDGSVNAIIDGPADVDVFSFDAVAGGATSVRIVPDSSGENEPRFSARVDVVAPSGEIVSRFVIPGRDFEVPLPETGTYSVLAYDFTHSQRGRFGIELECDNPVARTPQFIRGDCDLDGLVAGSVTDAVFLLDASFGDGRQPECLAACDANADGQVTGQVSDAVFLLGFSFLGGPPPPAPFPRCGPGFAVDEATGCEAGSAGCP